MVAASSGALDSAPAVSMVLSVCRGLDAPGPRPLLRLGPPGGWSVLAVLCPLGFCLSRGEHRILGCVPAPCASGPVLLESCSPRRSPLCGASARAA